MSTIEMTARWLDAASDHISAILVKETRQALKSRQFIATFSLMLAISWLISAFGIILYGAGIQYQETGRQFFSAYYMVLALASFVIVPFAAYRSLLSERDLNTYELLSITSLSPRRIVLGKLLSSLVQLFIYYSAIAPFIALTYCLNGITMTMIGLLLAMSLVVSIEFSMLSLMLSTFSRQRQTQVLLSLILLGGLIAIFFNSIWLVPALLLNEIAFDDPQFWWNLAIWASYLIPFFVLFVQIATAQLTFEAGNRSTGIRVTCSSIFGITIAWCAGWIWWIGPVGTGALSVSTICLISSLLVVWLGVVGLFAATEDDDFTHRVRRDLPSSQLLRLIAWPFLPGGGRGMAYTLIHLLLLWCATAYAVVFLGGGDVKWQEAAAALCDYVIFYLGFGAWLGRRLRRASHDVRASHIRVLVVFLVVGGCILPHLIQLWNLSKSDWSPLLFITDPVSTIYEIHDGRSAPKTLIILYVLAAGGVLLNVGAIWRGLAETVQTAPKPNAKQPPH